MISVQIGSRSNHIGAHVWNIQHELLQAQHESWDILFHRTSAGKVYPRLLTIDRKGSVLLPGGEGVEEPAENLPHTWSGSSRVFDQRVPNEAGATGKNSTMPSSWYNTLSDESRRTFRREYLLELSHVAECDSFDKYDAGICAVLESVHEYEEFGDKIRKLAEECDRVACFHVMCDADDGFGGVGSSILTCLEDEFPRKPTMAVPVSDRDVLSSSKLEQYANTVHRFVTQSNSRLSVPVCYDFEFGNRSRNSFPLAVANVVMMRPWCLGPVSLREYNAYFDVPLASLSMKSPLSAIWQNLSPLSRSSFGHSVDGFVREVVSVFGETEQEQLCHQEGDYSLSFNCPTPLWDVNHSRVSVATITKRDHQSANILYHLRAHLTAKAEVRKSSSDEVSEQIQDLEHVIQRFAA